jgi:nitrogen fixation/metabolism regulation signal transduction histidine kinase
MSRRRRISFERRILLLILTSGIFGTVLSLGFLWWSPYTPKVQWTFTILLLCLWLGFAFSAREKIIRPLQTISNMLAALHEGDYSIRAKRGKPGDALDDVMLEVNQLGSTLREQRLDALEATALLRKVMEEIDVAIFAFDDQNYLRLVNRAGERLLGHPLERLLGKTAEELNLAVCLQGDPKRVLDFAFPGSVGRWDMRRSTFRQGGLPHHLLVLADLSKALRDEERQVWQRLIRVIGHELNNSLAPIKSISGSMRSLLQKDPRPADWQEDMSQGLSIIAARADALSHFMGSYARLARLPQPQLQPITVSQWVNHVAGLETRLPITLKPGPDLVVKGDQSQLEQLLINLVRNAVDASLETSGAVEMGWGRSNNHLEVWVEDEGHGLATSDNLFVPFFTTKQGGTGVGLVLCRQIAEAHGGILTIENKPNGSGCRAILLLPLGP